MTRRMPPTRIGQAKFGGEPGARLKVCQSREGFASPVIAPPWNVRRDKAMTRDEWKVVTHPKLVLMLEAKRRGLGHLPACLGSSPIHPSLLASSRGSSSGCNSSRTCCTFLSIRSRYGLGSRSTYLVQLSCCSTSQGVGPPTRSSPREPSGRSHRLHFEAHVNMAKRPRIRARGLQRLRVHPERMGMFRGRPTTHEPPQ